MDHVLSPLDLLARQAPDGPVAIARPHRVAAAARWFTSHFPGEVLYAVKANPSPWVLDALWKNGVKGFDVASEAEVELVASRYPEARIAFMHPVKSRRAIARAFHEFGVKTFALDSEDELEKILTETGGAKDLTLMVRFAVSGDGSWAFDLRDQLDHVDDGADDENTALITSLGDTTGIPSIDFSSILVATDFDGDSVTGAAAGSFAITVQDDIPIQNSATATGTCQRTSALSRK